MSNNLTPGSYYGKLLGAGLTEVGDNKTPVLIVDVSITHQADGGEWQNITPVKREVNFWLSEKAFERSCDDLRALGFNGDFENPVFSDDLSVGSELNVTTEMYQGKTRDVVRFAKLSAGRERAQVSKDLVRTIAARFKQTGANTAKPTTPPPPRQAAAAAATTTAAGATLPATQTPRPPSAGSVNDDPPF